jgi:hypothetical protein
LVPKNLKCTLDIESLSFIVLFEVPNYNAIIFMILINNYRYDIWMTSYSYIFNAALVVIRITLRNFEILFVLFNSWIWYVYFPYFEFVPKNQILITQQESKQLNLIILFFILVLTIIIIIRIRLPLLSIWSQQ